MRHGCSLLPKIAGRRLLAGTHSSRPRATRGSSSSPLHGSREELGHVLGADVERLEVAEELLLRQPEDAWLGLGLGLGLGMGMGMGMGVGSG